MSSHAPFRFIDDPLPRKRFSMPDPAEMFLVLVVLVCGTVTAPQVIQVGSTSGLGYWTISIAAAVCVLWLGRPYFPKDLVPVLLPLMLFAFFAAVSIVWGGKADPTAQQLSVIFGMLGFLLVTAREVRRLPWLAREIHRAMDIASITAAVAYTLVLMKEGRAGELYLGNRPVFLARPFALFAMLCVARQVGRWLDGDKRGLWLGITLVALVFLSDSRTAMITCLALFPLGFLLLGTRKSVATAVVMAGAAAAVFVGAIMLSQDFYDRFFKYDASLQVGGVAINGSGRAKMWGCVLDHVKENWLFGKGVSTCSRLIEINFPGLGHPHNDFLSYLYEFGAFGLTLFVLFLLAAGFKMYVSLKRSIASSDGDQAIHMTPLLGLASVVVAMMTDNPVVYVYVMIPLAIFIGCSLGRSLVQTDVRPIVVGEIEESPSELETAGDDAGACDDAEFIAEVLQGAPAVADQADPPQFNDDPGRLQAGNRA